MTSTTPHTTSNTTSHTAPPTDPRIARSRAKLVDAATALLVEAGPRAVTVDAVSERSGVAKSTLYRHFASREELLVEVMRCNVPEFEAPEPGAAFEPSLRRLVHAIAATLDHPDWRAIMPAMISLQQHMPELADLSAEDRHEKFEVLGEVLELGVREGALPADLSPELVAQILIGPIVFAVISHRDDIAEVVDYVVDRFIASYR